MCISVYNRAGAVWRTLWSCEDEEVNMDLSRISQVTVIVTMATARQPAIHCSCYCANDVNYRAACKPSLRLPCLSMWCEQFTAPVTHFHCLQGSHSPGKPGIWPKKKSMHGKIMGFQKGHFYGKQWKKHGILFQLSTFFFNIRIHFAEFILCHLCFFLSLIFDYWTVVACAQIFWRENNLGE